MENWPMEYGKYAHMIDFDLSNLPTVLYTDYGSVEAPVLHVDRVANHEVLLLILSGCMPVVEDETEYFLKAGDLFFLKKGIHHYGRTELAPGTSWIYVHFTHKAPPADELELATDYSHMLHVYRRPQDYERRITLPKILHNMLHTEIETKLRDIEEKFASEKPAMMAYVNTSLHSLLMDIYLHARGESESHERDTRVQRMLQYLNRHIGDVLDPLDLETAMGLSYKHLMRIFKEGTGMTIHECHTNMKMESACRMLRDYSHSIATISERLGYTDPLYFSKVFSKAMGMSPRMWRQRERL